MRGLVLAGAVALGCVSVTRVGPDMFAIECRKMARCYDRAFRECPWGFDLVDTARKQGAVVTYYPGMTTVEPMNGGDILVRCRPANYVADPRQQTRSEEQLDEETKAARDSLRKPAPAPSSSLPKAQEL